MNPGLLFTFILSGAWLLGLIFLLATERQQVSNLYEQMEYESLVNGCVVIGAPALLIFLASGVTLCLT